VAVELGIPPCVTPDTFAICIMEGKDRINRTFLEDTGMELTIGSARMFRPEDLVSDQAQSFGCEPDYNAYVNGKMRPQPELKTFGNERFAGGHIHLGGEFNCPPFVAALFADLFLSLPFLCSPSAGTQPFDGSNRLAWYGQPGIFRHKPYGIEYRTPTNWWCNNRKNAMMMGAAAMRLCRFLSTTSPSAMRSMMKQIPWLDVQEFLSNTPVRAANRSERATQLCNEIAEKVGLEI
jgi:hypothetical protein